MIEGYILPAGCIMAGGTYRPELSIVGIPGGMAGIAIRGCPFEHTIGVTGHTLNILVLSGQGEGRLVVIEGHILPAAGVMTGAAVRTELTAMWIL